MGQKGAFVTKSKLEDAVEYRDNITVSILKSIGELQAKVESLPRGPWIDNRIEKAISDAIVSLPRQQHDILKDYIFAGAAIVKDGFQVGSGTVMTALTRDGRIAPDRPTEDKIEAVNLGEEDYTPVNEHPVPDIIIARNQKHAEQIGDRITDDLMKVMDKTV